MSNLIIILGHCDTPEKLKILRKNIDILKLETEFDILLSSSHPIPIDIQSKVDYFIYSNNNPILYWPERGLINEWWFTTGDGFKQTLRSIHPDHGFAVFQQILNSSNYSLPLDYTHYSIINYDINLTSEVKEAINSYKEYTVLTSFHQQINKNIVFPSLIFNILDKKSLKSINSLINRKIYTEGIRLVNPKTHEISYKDFIDAESYWEHLTSNFRHTNLPTPVTDLVANQVKINILPDYYPFEAFHSVNNHQDFDPVDPEDSELNPPRFIIYKNSNNEEVTVYFNDKSFTTTQYYDVINLPTELYNLTLKYKEEIIDLLPLTHQRVTRSIKIEKI